MKGLPIPHSLQGWTCALVLLLLLFASYYLYLFPYLHAFYFEERAGCPALYTQSLSEDNSCPSFLRVRIDSPRQIAPFGKRWVYIAIKNDSNSPVSLTASLVITPGLAGWYMPFLFGSSTSDATSLTFSPINPYATAYGRIPLFSTEAITEAGIHIHFDDGGKNCYVPINQPPGRNPRRFLAHSLTEQLLLPPWSNWLLAAVGLLIAVVIEPSKDQESANKFSVPVFLRMLWLSLTLSLIFIAGLLLIISAIWWPIEREAGGGLNIAAIVVSTAALIFFMGSVVLELEKSPRTWLELGIPWYIAIIVIIVLLVATLILLFLTRFPLLESLSGLFITLVVLEVLRSLFRIKKLFCCPKGILDGLLASLRSTENQAPEN